MGTFAAGALVYVFEIQAVVGIVLLAAVIGSIGIGAFRALRFTTFEAREREKQPLS